MFVVIVGCSEVGFFLSRALAATGHEVAVIEREPHRYQVLTENMGMVTLCWEMVRTWSPEKGRSGAGGRRCRADRS